MLDFKKTEGYAELVLNWRLVNEEILQFYDLTTKENKFWNKDYEQIPFGYLIILPFTLSSIILSIPIRNVFEPSEGWFQIEACKFG